MQDDANLQDVEAQIAALQAQAAKLRAEKERAAAEEERKRKAGILAPQSPSPKKKPRLETPVARPHQQRDEPKQPDFVAKPVEAPSRFNQGLDRSRDKLQSNAERRDQPKSKGFERTSRDKPATPPRVRDNDDLTVIEDLQLGPREFKPFKDDLTWQNYEPNSKTRLKSRLLPHDELQEYLDDRYALSPSQLYSVVRESRGGTEYEVPLEHDWIVIGTLAEKSDIKTTNPQVKVEVDEVEEALKGREEDDDDDKPRKKRKPPARKAKKFVSFKLVDLGGRGSSGDAVLNLLLFESDSAVYAETGEPVEEEITAKNVRLRKEDRRERQDKRYIGGSYGAYERFWKESDGALVAVINPKVMKPRAASNGFAASNVISITPENAESMLVIGRARDLGHCQAVRRDGKTCGAWLDQRVNSACDFHVQEALKRSRSGRSELMVGTSGMQVARIGRMGGKASAQPDFDSKTGLLPDRNVSVVEGNKTWVVAGSSRPAGKRMGAQKLDSSRAAISETAASAPTKKSKQQKAEEEAALLKRLKRDGGKTIGGQYLRASGAKDESDGESDKEDKTVKPGAFKARQIRQLGFNPNARPGDSKPLEPKDNQRQILEAPTGIKRTLGKRSKTAVVQEEEDDDDLLVVAEEPAASPVLVEPPAKRVATKISGLDNDDRDELSRLMNDFKKRKDTTL